VAASAIEQCGCLVHPSFGVRKQLRGGPGSPVVVHRLVHHDNIDPAVRAAVRPME